MISPLSTLSRHVLPTAVSTGKVLLRTGTQVARTLPERAGSLPGTAWSGVAKARGVLSHPEDLAARGVEVISVLRSKVPLPVVGTQRAQEQAQEAMERVVDPFGLPEPVAELVEQAAPGATLSHDELPLADYDHLTLGSLRARIRRLDAPALIQLRDYERAHANRLPVMLAFENRLKSIAAEAPGAEQATLVDA